MQMRVATLGLLERVDTALVCTGGRNPIPFVTHQCLRNAIGSSILLTHVNSYPISVQADANGVTPLYAAADRGNPVMTVALLGAGTTSANVAFKGVTPMLAAMRNRHWAVAEMMLAANNACIVVDSAVATTCVTDALQAAAPGHGMFHAATGCGKSLIQALAKAKSVVFGSNLRGKQLWLWSNLRTVVSGTLNVTVSRFSLLDSLRSDFGINEETGHIVRDAGPRHLDVTFVGEDSSGDGLRRELLQMATSDICDLQRGLFISSDGGRTLQPNPDSSVLAGSEHLSYFTLLGCITGRSKTPLATDNLLESTDGGRRTTSVLSRGGTLLPCIYADSRYIDAVIVSKGVRSTIKRPSPQRSGPRRSSKLH